METLVLPGHPRKMKAKGKHVVSPVLKNILLWNGHAKFWLNIPLDMSTVSLFSMKEEFWMKNCMCMLLHCRTWQVVEGCCAVLWLNSGRLCHLPCSCCQASFDSWMLINPKSFQPLLWNFSFSALRLLHEIGLFIPHSPRAENFNSVSTKCLFFFLYARPFISLLLQISN